MIAGTLELQMLANLARLQSDMTQAKGMVSGAMKSIESSVSMAKGALASLGIGLGVGYFASLIKGSIDAMDNLRDLGKTTSIIVEQLAGLRLAAQQSGSNLEGTAKSISFLSKNIGANAEEYRKLGITAKEPLEAFKQLADIYVKLNDPQQRAAVMTKALGKSWETAAPLLSEGGEKIGEMVEKGTKLSGVTKQLTDDADEFKDKLAEMGVSASGATTRLTGALLPALTALVDNFTLVRNVVLSLIAAKVVPWAVAQATALYGTVTANMAATAATLATANANVVSTGAVAFHTKARVAEAAALVSSTSGMGALTLVTTALLPAQARAAAAAAAHASALDAQAVAAKAASVSSGIAGAALGLLGGPIGWITLALGLGATAWALWGKSAEDAAGQAEKAVERGLAIAKRIQDQSKFGTGEAGTLNEALSAARQNLANEIENFVAAEALIKTEADASSVMEKYSASIADAQDVVDTLTQALYKATASTGGLTDEQKNAAAAAAAFLKEEKKATEDILAPYNRLNASIAERTALLQAELDETEPLTEAEKIWLKLEQDIAEGQIKFNATLFAEAAARLSVMESIENGLRAKKREADALKTYVTTEQEWLAVMKEANEILAARGKVKGDAAFATDKQIEQMQFETKLIGMTNVQREQEIFLRQALIDKISEGATARGKEAIAAKHAAQEANDSQVDLWKSVESAGHQAFLSIFDTSKNVLERIRDMLKTHLIDILYQMTVKKWKFNIVASVSGAGVAQQAIGSVGGASIGNLGGSLLSGVTGFGADYALGASMGSAMLEAGGALTIGTEIGASAAAAFGTSIATAIPYVGIAIAAASALGLFGSSGGPASFTGLEAQGDISRSGFAGQFFGTSRNSEESFRWDTFAPGGMDALNRQITSLFDTLASAGAKLGLDTASLNSASVAFSAAGLPGQETGQTVAAMIQQMNGVSDQLVTSLMPNLADFQRANESLTQTFIRLSEEAAAIATQRRGLEIRLMEAEGNAAGALAARREDELAAMDASLRPLQEQIYAEEDAHAAWTAARDRRALEIQLMEVQGDAAGALAARRALEIEAMDESLRPLQAMINAAEDAATAAAKAAETATTRQGWLDQLDVLMGKTTEREIERKRLLASTTDETTLSFMRQVFAAQDLADATSAATQATRDQAATIRSIYDQAVASAEQALRTAYQREVDLQREREAAVKTAEQALRNAYQSQASALEDTVAKWGDAAKTLREYSATLSGVTASASGNGYAFTQSQFASVAARAQLGDMDAVGQLQSVGEAFRTASEASSATRTDYLRDIGRIQAAVIDTADVADRQQNIARDSLDALTRQVSALISIDERVLSVAEAVSALQTAQDAEAVGQRALDAMTTQVSALITVNESVLSVADAIDNLVATLVGRATQGGARGTLAGALGYDQWLDLTNGGRLWASSAGATLTQRPGQSAADAMIYGKTGAQFTAGSAAAWAQQQIGADNAIAVYARAMQEGISLSSANALIGLPSGTAEDWARSMGLPIFHSGIAFVPQTGPALLQRGERVTSAAANDEQVNVLNGLRDDVRALKAEVVEIRRTNRELLNIADKHDGEGAPTYAVAAP